jgi:hypothetical protein
MNRIVRAIVLIATAACIVLLVSLLAGCAPKRPLVITTPEHVETVRQVYVRVPDSLTAPHPIAPLESISSCPTVAAERRRELEQCNADKAATRAIQGTKAD